MHSFPKLDLSRGLLCSVTGTLYRVSRCLCLPKKNLCNNDLVVWCKLGAYGEGSHCSQDTQTKAGGYEFKTSLWNMKPCIKEIKYKVKQANKQEPHTCYKYTTKSYWWNK